MSRRIIDRVVLNNKFSNYDLFTQVQSDARYHGQVEKKYAQLLMEDPNKGAEPIYLVDLILGGTEFPQDGSEFQFIGGGKVYELSKKDFKRVKALAVGQINPVEDVSRGIADAVLWFNGEERERTGTLLYNQVFKVAKQRLYNILNPEAPIETVEVDGVFKAAIDKMHGQV